ncbi:tetratricopeptide repeat protein [Acidicapsa ligni]|uniref:tetratricopeptide repeat protein n=1 Tax=Acidicapsa ligni TaxID=542300 RepID=UPI0021E0C030|nr:tetratricopeptide repeat protein [Acidicapsa ligni]
MNLSSYCWHRFVIVALSLVGMMLGAFGSVDCAYAAVKSDTSNEVTWSRDIAPVLYKNCVSCHHRGGAGPFSLMTYADAKRWSAQVVMATQSRFMPPWLPEPGHGDFADVRRLPDADLAMLRKWVALGMAEGDVKDAPVAPKFESTWGELGTPDVILKIAQPFTLPAGGTDVFRNFVLPYPLKEGHYIRAMEILPGAASVVHHANVLIDRTGSYRRQHPTDWRQGVAGMEILLDAGNSFDPDSHFLFWKPDTPALIEPEGMPWRLDPGNDLILNMHLKPSGKAETIDAQVGLYFTDKPPTKLPMLLQLDRDDALDIPAGDKAFVVEDELTLPVDVEVLGIYPHAHYLGKDMQGWAMLPDGQKKWLVWIRDWDIDRQSVYRYKEPVQLPKGTVVHMRYTYDNSAMNVRNPHNPPVRVKAGNRSEDEMAHMWLQVLPMHGKPGDPDQRLLLEEAWMRQRLKKAPTDRISLYNLGAALAGEGKFAQAVAVYEQDRQAHLEDARTLTALGAALEGAGDWRQAMERYREVAANSGSASCDARFDLARLEQRHEMYADAVRDFRAQLATCPEDAETHSGLGAALEGAGESDAARVEFMRALAIHREDFTASLGLGELSLEAGQFNDAASRFVEAVRLDPASLEARERLAQAYASDGHVNDAITELIAAEKSNPEVAEVHALLSQMLGMSGQIAEAIAEERAALKLNANDADGWNNLGVLEARSGQTDAARADFEHALRLQPDHAEAKANLARLLPAH